MSAPSLSAGVEAGLEAPPPAPCCWSAGRCGRRRAARATSTVRSVEPSSITSHSTSSTPGTSRGQLGERLRELVLLVEAGDLDDELHRKEGVQASLGRGGREQASPGPGGPPGSANPRWYCAESRWTALHAALATSFSRRVRHRALDTRRAVRRFRRVSARLGSRRAPFSPFRGACHAPQRPSRAAGGRASSAWSVFLLRPTFPNYDSYYDLVWGKALASGHLPGLQRAAPAHAASAGGGARGLPVAVRRRGRPHLRADRHRVVPRPARGGLPLHAASARHADRVRVDARAPHPHATSSSTPCARWWTCRSCCSCSRPRCSC